MSVDSVLARGRTAARMLMRDRIVITRVTGTVFNPVSHDYDDTTTTLYDGETAGAGGPADVKPLDVGDREVQAGEREVALRTFDVKLPFGTVPTGTVGDFTRGDLVTVTASEDPTLVGRALTLVGIGRGARRTARHLDAEDRT